MMIYKMLRLNSEQRFVSFFLISLLVGVGTVLPQVRPVYDRGAMGLGQLLKRLNTSASVMMIGAHPDDEDTALLAYLARGESARTAYLSLTRGDGGQNIIGPELGEALGIIRTEELLQARRLDGAEQFFTRAYDYGFSKTLAEAKQKWDEKVILCDTVRVIRVFRPLVVISQFSGTPADGHGQHQFAGYIAPLAVKAAADASQCTEAGSAWKVQKFYVRHGFRASGEPKLKINTGKYDPLLGRSYFEIAMEARSQHKSQEQGVLELKGDQFSGLNLVESRVPKIEPEKSVFDGIDTSFGAIATTYRDARRPLLSSRRMSLVSADGLLKSALKEFAPNNSSMTLESLLQAYGSVSHALEYDPAYLVSPSGEETMLDTIDIDRVLQYHHGLLEDAITNALGLQIDALADAETVVPGESLNIAIKVFFSHSDDAVVEKIEIEAPKGYKVSKLEEPALPNNSGPARREVTKASARLKVDVPSDAEASQPYWLSQPRGNDLYIWPRNFYLTSPFGSPLLYVKVSMRVRAKPITFTRRVEYRFADDIRGEVRRNVDVVPNVSVEMDQSLMIVPYSDKPQTRQFVITVTNHSKQGMTGVLALNFNASSEWKYSASAKTFDIKKTGEKATVTFEVTIPAGTKPGSYQISGNAMVGESLATSTMRTIAYPHIQTHRFYRRATVDVQVMELKTAPGKVGYITGSGDRVSEAIRQMGFDLEVISERDLAGGNLSRFDVIVVGIRAYQVRSDVVANNQRLNDFAKNGGTLIVQYQLPPYAQQGLTPFPATMGPRVSDETAKVTLLQSEHPIFNFPNKITDADFLGWVQERNLYNFSTFDAKYIPLLESHDAGEPENKGGLVIAQLGKGNYVYCSYSFFRQLPAGVSGAYRLFANLLSLPKARSEPPA